MQFNNPLRKIKNNMATPHLKKSMSGSPLRLGFFLAALALVCFGLSPAAQAVSPPPDGGYPNFNTAEGDGALFNLTTGSANTALGFEALFSNTAGGANTATGFRALRFNTSGGHSNTANGAQALYHNTTGDDNVAIGSGALSDSTTGRFNTAIGSEALGFNETGNNNTAIGQSAALATTTGGSNTAIGFDALSSITTGERNVALGDRAGSQLTGSNNIVIGSEVVGVAGQSNTIRIGKNITGTFIDGINGATASGGAAVFVVGEGGKLGTMTSSARFKDEIKPMDKASEVILALKPVSFRYKKEVDPQRVAQFGLVAEDVEKINPDLVIRDAQGRPQTVRYEQVNAMLLNEFLKEHRKNEEQEKTIAELKSGMTALAATVKEQASQIQKVSAQLEAGKSAPQVVKNP